MHENKHLLLCLYIWDDSDVILSEIVTPAMLEVYNVVTL